LSKTCSTPSSQNKLNIYVRETQTTTIVKENNITHLVVKKIQTFGGMAPKSGYPLREE
jgi:hypothetical protein